MVIKRILILITVFSLAGCTSMRPMDISEPDFAEQLEAGDHLVVYEKSGRVIDMTLAQVEDTKLVGSWHDNGYDTVDIEIDQIVKIEIEKISGPKTTAAVVGGIILIPVVAAGAAVAVVAGAY